MPGRELRIHNVFKLSDGMTAIACDQPTTACAWANRRIRIVSDEGEERQELVISGVRLLARQTEHRDQIAIETLATVLLSSKEAQGGRWLIVL